MLTASAGFQTDTDISASNRTGERELKPWVPDEPESNGGAATNGGARGDIITFGGPVSNIPWDQFETNTRLFGAKTDYDEELYTTKLDRSSPGYKKREREADRLANEILSKTSTNSHIAEERNQTVAGETKDEEEKYSGVVRNPNAYVPPGARKTGGGGLPVRKDGTTPPPPPKEAPAPAAPAPKATAPAEKETTTDVPLPPMPKGNGPAASSTTAKHSNLQQSSTPPPATASNNGPRLSADPVIDPAIASSSLGPGPATSMTRSTSSVPQGQTQTQATNGATSPGGSASTHAPAPIGAVVDQARQFVESERERVTARKQSMAKNERAHVLAEFKSWQAKFKVPLPVPKDILPILTKDEQKQKEIEEKAAKALKDAEENRKHAAAAAKSPLSKPANLMSPNLNLPKPPVQTQPKKIVMKIPEIPPFRKKVPPAVPVPETASQNIAVTSPTPSNASVTSGHARLNPNASSFVFKPNPSAAAFKPGEFTSPKPGASKLGSGGGGPPSIPGSSSSPAPPPSVSPAPAGGSSSAPATPKNPFYKDGPPKRIVVNPRDDFNPFKHGQVPPASSVVPQWPYTGRRSSVAYSQPMHPMAMQNYDGGVGGASGDDPSSPHLGPPPMLQGGIPPNLLPFYRYQPNVNVPPQMQGAMMGQMFPGPGGFVPPQMQGSPHMQQGPQHGPNGSEYESRDAREVLAGASRQKWTRRSSEQLLKKASPNSCCKPHKTKLTPVPMYFTNSMPPNAQFIPPQMHFHPNGPGRPPQGPMFYGQQMGHMGHQHQHQHGHQHQAPQMQPQMSQMSQMSYTGQPTPPQPHFQQLPNPPVPPGVPGFDGSPAQ